MSATHDPQGKPLAQSRPWLTVAGCLGGGMIAIALAFALLIAAVVVFVFFPEIVGMGKPGPTAFINAIGELRKAPALRVGTREIAVHVDASVPTETTIRAWLVPVGPGWKVEVGRTKVDVFAPGNTVQYIVPLEIDGKKLETPVKFGHAKPNGTAGGAADDQIWTVTLPPPRVDQSLVEVQSDPRKIRIEVDRDWVDHVVGDDKAKDAALASIRAAVVKQASSETATFEVREKGRAVVADMIRALLPEQFRDRRIVVRWSDEPAAD
jgi:hypothetical protein